ncbi:MAG TPA: archease [Verrucomicrobiae bacterium]
MKATSMTNKPRPEAPAGRAPDWLQAMDHTADCGVIVRARDLKELFARAAWGMFSIITDLNAVKPVQTETLVVTATDREALLVRWLSELNFQHVTRHQLFCRFEVRELRDDRLVAEVSGEAVAPERHTVYTEIKAVTFHGLRLEEVKQEGWRAAIIFDL